MHLMEPTCQLTQAPLILNVCTTWRWSASRFGRITVVRTSGSYRIGGWVGPDLVRKLQRRDKSLPCLRLHGAMSAFSTATGVHSVAKWCPVCFIKRVFIASCVLLTWVLLTMKFKVVLRLHLLFCILLKVACRWFGQSFQLSGRITVEYKSHFAIVSQHSTLQLYAVSAIL
jgi:hypothetical protein